MSHSGVAPSLAEPPLELPDGITTWLPIYCVGPNTHLPKEGLGSVYCFLLIPVFLEGYLLMGRRGGSFPSYVSPKTGVSRVLGSTCEK